MKLLAAAAFLLCTSASYAQAPAVSPPAAMAAQPAKAGPFATATHQKNAENKLPNGWHQANSTDGPFSVELPGPFTDMTVVKDATMHMLIASDPSGSTFLAMLERAGDGGMTKKFEADLLTAGPAATRFRGFTSLVEHRLVRGVDTVSTLRFMTPAGLYTLSMVSVMKEGAQRTALQEHFWNSLVLR